MGDPLATFRAAAADLGLQVQLGLGPAYDLRAGEGLRLRDLAPWARGGLLLLSGGGAFFDRFRADGPPAGDDPLDRWTRARVEELLAPLRAAGVRAAAHHPFWNEPDPLPFQRIGAAAGLPTAVPLGLHLHPVYGTWLAYRALILLDVPVEEAPPLPADPCAGCDAPCLAACPAGAVTAGGWNALACVDHRVAGADPCADGCHARLACPRGARHRYPLPTRRFHQAASHATARAFRTPR